MKTVKDVVAFARANPGKLIYGTSGIGSIGHLAGEVLSQTTGVTMTHVPFKTAGQAYPDMMTGTLNMIIDTLPSAMNHIKSGTARPVAMLSPGRNAMFPDVPTIAEAGFPDATLVFWSAVHGPAGMNPAVVQRLHDAMVKSLAAPDLRERFGALGAEPWVATGKDVDTRARRDYDSLGKVIKAAGIKQE
jgi:tripartite-type tricarboxylate transporter receptor subunit TctC